MKKITVTINAKFWDFHLSQFSYFYADGGEYENEAVEIDRWVSRVRIELSADALKRIKSHAEFTSWNMVSGWLDVSLMKSARSAFFDLESVAV